VVQRIRKIPLSVCLLPLLLTCIGGGSQGATCKCRGTTRCGGTTARAARRWALTALGLGLGLGTLAHPNPILNPNPWRPQVEALTDAARTNSISLERRNTLSAGRMLQLDPAQYASMT
jgi:hypothetical protein